MSFNDKGEFEFYAYTPSLPAAVIFIVLFFGSAAWHVKQLFQNRTWYFIPFVIGCLCMFPPCSLLLAPCSLLPFE